MQPSSSNRRLLIYGSEWAMRELPKDAERFWSREEILQEISRAGFDGMQAPLEWAQPVRDAGLRFCTSGRANTPAEIRELVAKASDCGADFATLHLGWGDESDAEMDALVAETLVAAAKYKVPLWPETHRATILQDVWRTLRLLERFPKLRLNLDLSHYYCSQEIVYRGFEANAAIWQPILKQAGCFHGRVSNAHAMQIPIADIGYVRHVEQFQELWGQAMSYWLQQAGPNDTLAFIPELGPPSSGYALAIPAFGGKRTELADRWSEMKLLAHIARALFKESVSK